MDFPLYFCPVWTDFQFLFMWTLTLYFCLLDCLPGFLNFCLCLRITPSACHLIKLIFYYYPESALGSPSLFLTEQTSQALNQRTQGIFYFYLFLDCLPFPPAILQQDQDWLGHLLVHLLQEDLSVSMYASLLSASVEGSGFEEETLYDLFIDRLTGTIRDAVLFA